ncbi:hypothetical protein [Streptosporangium sp. NPDC002524]|uniref:hypothetical protein n=1 Tax=Streptosporangium sp. NPDC002524 TaxID=3154537 RepID=UPI00332BFD00
MKALAALVAVAALVGVALGALVWAVPMVLAWVLPAAAVAWLAYLAGKKTGAAREAAETARLAARLETFTRILAPLPETMRRGAVWCDIPQEDLATLALLVAHPDDVGETLVDLEARLNDPRPNP